MESDLYVRSKQLNKASSDSRASGSQDYRRYRSAICSSREMRSITHPPPLPPRPEAPPIPPRAESKMMKVNITANETSTSKEGNGYNLHVEAEELEITVGEGTVKLKQPHSFTKSAIMYAARSIFGKWEKQEPPRPMIEYQPGQCDDCAVSTTNAQSGNAASSTLELLRTRKRQHSTFHRLERKISKHFKTLVVLGLFPVLYWLLFFVSYTNEDEDLTYKEGAVLLLKVMRKLANKVWREFFTDWFHWPKIWMFSLKNICTFVYEESP